MCVSSTRGNEIKCPRGSKFGPVAFGSELTSADTLTIAGNPETRNPIVPQLEKGGTYSCRIVYLEILPNRWCR